MNDSLFTEGITHFMLIDEQGNALSERLIFVPDHKPNQWKSLQTNRRMEKREGIFTDRCQRQRGQPGRRYFSASPTEKVFSPTLSPIISCPIFLTSDLKGYEEDPAFYFLNQDAGRSVPSTI